MRKVTNLQMSMVQSGKETTQEIGEKEQLVRRITNLIKRNRLRNTEELKYIFKRVRERLDLQKLKKPKKLPVLLTTDELSKLMSIIDNQPTDDFRDQVLFRLLLCCGLRVAELVSIKIDDLNLVEKKIFITQGKGNKDRTVLITDKLKILLAAYLKINPNQHYLFENNRNQFISTKMVQRLCKKYQQMAGITKNIHPHLFRHQSLTFLTEQGLSDAQIQLISGHSSKKSLEIYQHLSLRDVRDDYQEAMKKLGW